MTPWVTSISYSLLMLDHTRYASRPQPSTNPGHYVKHFRYAFRVGFREGVADRKHSLRRQTEYDSASISQSGAFTPSCYANKVGATHHPRAQSSDVLNSNHLSVRIQGKLVHLLRLFHRILGRENVVKFFQGPLLSLWHHEVPHAELYCVPDHEDYVCFPALVSSRPNIK